MKILVTGALVKAPKRGFGVPLREWFKKGNEVSKLNLKNINHIKPEVVNKIMAENKKGLSDNGNFIWTMIMLDKMIRQ